jgi:hypothetical protein
MFSEDLKDFKNKIHDNIIEAKRIKEEHPEAISGNNNNRFSNLDYHLTVAYNIINEILSNKGGQYLCK